LKKGTIADLGLASSPDVEKIIMIDPEAIFASPIQGLPYGSVEKTGIPIIETPDYMESTPLGRLEWIRFCSLFIGKEQVADSIFYDVEEKYNNIKEIVGKAENRPTVLTDLKYGNVWYAPGGKSFIANLLYDAGAKFVISDDDKTGSVPLSFETVLDRGGEADFWLIKYNQPVSLTYKALKKEYAGYSYFEAFENRNIYECNTGKVPYYEDISVRPDLILQDLAFVFHPGLFPGYTPRYYFKMKE